MSFLADILDNRYYIYLNDISVDFELERYMQL